MLSIECLESRAMLDGNLGILLLDHSSAGTLSSAGAGGVEVTNGTLAIDSSSSLAGIDLGKGNVSASTISVVGGVKAYASGKFEGAHVHSAAVADPLLGLPAPPTTTPVHSAVNATGNVSLTLSPGTYKGGIHISGNASVTLLAGNYYLEGGGLWVLGNAKLNGSGVMIYNGAKTAGDEILLGGNATVSLTAANSGTYQNIVIFQNRTVAAPIVVSGGNIQLTGKIYAAKAALYFSGSQPLDIGGSATDGVTGGLIVKDLITSGKGAITVDATNYSGADLAIMITDDAGGSSVSALSGGAIPGTQITYTITVTNNGPLSVTGATVTDSFPDDISDDSYTAIATGEASGFTLSGSGNISDTVDLAAGSTIVYTVKVDIKSSVIDTLSDTATVTGPASPVDPNPANNTATDTDTLTPRVQLVVVETDDAGGSTSSNTTGTVNAGSPITYTITLTNNGPSDAVGASLTDNIPDSLVNSTFTGNGGTESSSTGGGSDTFAPLNIPAGGTMTFTLTGTVDSGASGTISNTVTATQGTGETLAAGSVTTATVTDNVSDLTATVTDDHGGSSSTEAVGVVPQGDTITYTIVVTNVSSNTVGFNVQGEVFDPLAIFAGVFDVGSVSVSNVALSGSGATDTQTTGNVLINDNVTLPAGGSVTYTMTVQTLAIFPVETRFGEQTGDGIISGVTVTPTTGPVLRPAVEDTVS